MPDLIYPRVDAYPSDVESLEWRNMQKFMMNFYRLHFRHLNAMKMKKEVIWLILDIKGSETVLNLMSTGRDSEIIANRLNSKENYSCRIYPLIY